MAGISKQDVDTPALLVDVDALERNIRKMQDFATSYGVNLRPHCKTHKCTTIARKQMEAGAFGITCAKLGEAEAMAKAGIRNLLIANQVVGPLKIARLVELARISDVIVAVDDVVNGKQISAAAVAAGRKVNVIIEVNTGMNRCGTEPGQPTLKLAQALLKLKGLNFRGLMGYEGHAVNIRDFVERKRVVEVALGKLTATAELLRKNKVPVEIVSAGGTGSYRITTAFRGITETQVGSYATMDGAYQDVGVEFEQALTMLAMVVSRPTKTRVVLDAGKKVCTEEFGLPRLKDLKGAKVRGLSEEHCTLDLSDPKCKLKPGDKIELIPTHGCTTINLHDQFLALCGGKVVGIWPIEARGKAR